MISSQQNMFVNQVSSSPPNTAKVDEGGIRSWSRPRVASNTYAVLVVTYQRHILHKYLKLDDGNGADDDDFRVK